MSAENGTEKSNAAAEGQHQPAPPENNFERLMTHLRKNSLAAKLVSAYAAPDEGTSAQAIKDVMADRLDELKNSYDSPEDQKN